MSEEVVRDGVGFAYRSPLPKLNIELLRDCVHWVEHNDELKDQPLWRQEIWAEPLSRFDRSFRVSEERLPYCNTAYCVAGYAVARSGASQYPSQIKGNWLCANRQSNASVTPLTDPNMVGYDGNLVAPNASNWGDIEWGTAAQALLGLTDYEASRLFRGNNSSVDVRDLAESIAKSRGYELFPEGEKQ